MAFLSSENVRRQYFERQFRPNPVTYIVKLLWRMWQAGYVTHDSALREAKDFVENACVRRVTYVADDFIVEAGTESVPGPNGEQTWVGLT